MRRPKFEKSGLQLVTSTLSGNGSSHTASTGTGTGTSDTEDEGSTPSAENAERSLASTLGGSSENLPQSNNSFLHAALPEGPGLTMERGTSSKISRATLYIKRFFIFLSSPRSPQHQCQAQHGEWQERGGTAHHHQVVYEHQEGGTAAGHQQGQAAAGECKCGASSISAYFPDFYFPI